MTAQDIRLLIGDNQEFFSDDELKQFLTLNSGSIKRAAADALDSIASNEALLSKKITTQDRSTDGPAVAEALRRHAEALRHQARQEELDAEDDPFVDVFRIGGGR